LECAANAFVLIFGNALHLAGPALRFFETSRSLPTTRNVKQVLPPKNMTLETRINAVGDSIRLLMKRLTERGFEFGRPSEVLPGPENGTTEAIARIEREVGAVPLALRLFWQRVGSVNFWGSHPEWEGYEYPDPLVVYPPSAAIEELEEFLADREGRLRCTFPYIVPIAPDAKHKEGVSGGMWYNVSVAAGSDDPPLNDEPHQTTFVAYELAVQWAGFPGLSYGPGTWPIAELVREIHLGGS